MKNDVGILEAILFGHMIVNIPGLVIMGGMTVIGLVIFFANNFFWLGMTCIFIGFILAWLWWSYTVPRWRRWAIRQGIDPEKLHKWAVIAGLVWPKGWIFEKTEFKLKDDE